jgi:cell shape-determining protein MreC
MNGYTGEHKINNQRKRADKWAKKYSEDLKNYKKLIIENEQLRQTNHELNLMHHQAIMKVLHLGQQLKKEKEND